MNKARNVSNKCVNLPKILTVFIYSFIQTYIYLYPIYNSKLTKQQVNKGSLSESSRYLQQKSCQLKKLKENNRFSIAIKYYFYILLNIIIANSSQQFTADQSIGLHRHSHTNETKSFHREDYILPWPWANPGGLCKCYWTAKSVLIGLDKKQTWMQLEPQERFFFSSRNELEYTSKVYFTSPSTCNEH